MPFLHYNPDITNRSNVRGIYTTQDRAKKPFIQISEHQLAKFKEDPNQYTVVGGKLELVDEQFSNFTKAKAINIERKQAKQTIIASLEVGNYVYTPDAAFQQNISMLLGIHAMDSEYVSRLWCKDLDSDTWSLIDHSGQMILEIAKAFNERREQISELLYKK